MAFLQAIDLVHHTPAQQSEVAGIRWNFDLRNLVDQFVPGYGYHFFDPGLAVAGASL
jgi:hypothetical protein